MIGSMRPVALLTLLAFGCATVRVPVASAGDPAEPEGAIAPPMLDLWLESSDPVPPAERDRAGQQAREALDQALQGRRVAPHAQGAADPVLFVRERGVGLTAARRSQQTWAKVGIVVGIVVVVAVVVIAIASGKGGESGSKAAGAAHVATPVTHATVPVVMRPHVVPAPLPGPVVPGVGHAAHLPRAWGPRVYGPDVPFIWWDFNFYVPPEPLVLAPEGDEPPPAFAVDDGPSPIIADAEPPAPEQQPEPPPPPPPPELQLPLLAESVDFPVQDRGFFAGPRTALQVDLLDRATGRAVWTRAVADDVDPLDARAVARLMDDALEGQDWSR